MGVGWCSGLVEWEGLGDCFAGLFPGKRLGVFEWCWIFFEELGVDLLVVIDNVFGGVLPRCSHSCRGGGGR